MRTERQHRQIVRFGAFEADILNCELRMRGLRVRLQDQPFRFLALLLHRRGEIVPREEIREVLWNDDTFVEYDHGINTAMRKIRRALNDSAKNPRFIETLPRRGYRFIAPAEFVIHQPRYKTASPSNHGWIGALAGVATFVEKGLGMILRNRG